MVNMTGGKQANQTSVNVRLMRLFWSRVWRRAGVSGHLEKTGRLVHRFLNSYMCLGVVWVYSEALE
jgi:hypothetical protein